MSHAFVVVDTPEQAVDRLAALHEQATGALSQALKRYLKDRTEPDTDERDLFRYPALRLTYYSHGEVAATTRAYAKVRLPAPTASPSPSPLRSVATCLSNCAR